MRSVDHTGELRPGLQINAPDLLEAERLRPKNFADD